MAEQAQRLADLGFLLDCPFCGERAVLKTGVHTQYVMCLGCETMGPNLGSDVKCREAWNRRSTPNEVRP